IQADRYATRSVPKGDDHIAGPPRMVGRRAARRARSQRLSGGSMTTARLSAARVLVLGRAPDVLEAGTRELAALGVAVRGSSAPERAADEFNAGDFDLIAFGRGVLGEPGERLRQEFRHQNAQVRFLDTEAPTAVRQVMAALDNDAESSLVDLDA